MAAVRRSSRRCAPRFSTSSGWRSTRWRSPRASPSTRGGAAAGCSPASRTTPASSAAYRTLADDVRAGSSSSPAGDWLLDNFHLVAAEIPDIRASTCRAATTPAADAGATRARRRRARLRDGRRAHPPQRQPARPPAAGRVPEQLPARRAADDRRALGVAEHAEAGAHREPAPAGRGDLLVARAPGWPPTATSRRREDGASPHAQPAEPAFTRVRRPAAAPRPRVRPRPPSGAARRRRPTSRRSTRRPKTSIRGEHQRQGVAQVSVANAITSLRLCATLDWREYVESVSLVEQVLQRDPAGAYGRMDFLSRDRQRQAVEELAEPERRSPGAGGAEGGRERPPGAPPADRRRSRRPRRLSPRRPRAARSRGRRRLSARRCATRLAPAPPAPRHARLSRRDRAASTALLVVAAVASTQRHEAAVRRARRRRAAGAAAGSDFAIALVQRGWSSALVTPARLPRLDFSRRRPGTARGRWSSSRRMLTSVAGVDALLEHIEVLALGNLDPCIHFAHPQRLRRRRRAADAPEDARDPGRAREPASRRSTASSAPSTPTASSSSTATGSGTPASTRGWAGSASAARSRSSTACCAAPPTRASRRRSARSTCCRRSATASRSTPTRGCRATPPKR